jgi:hypothetical protein
MNAPIQSGLELRWFLPLFVLGWCGIIAFLSLIGGWHALSKRYRAVQPVQGRLFAFASMGLGRSFFPVSYGSCLFVRVGAAGIGLSIFPIYRILHPPLFIPWSAAAECKREKFWWFTHTAVYLTDFQTRILFTGRLGRAIYESWTSEHLQVQPSR